MNSDPAIPVSVKARVRMSCDERRQQIVAHAIRLFSENGFRGTTTRSLAAAAGITEPVLYQHFQNKSDLYDAILEMKAREGYERSQQVLGPWVRSSDDGAFFSCLADLILEHYDRDPAFIRLLLFSALEKHELAELFYQRQLVGFYKLISGYLRRRMKEGGLRRIDPKLAASAFLGMVNHHAQSEVLFGRRMVRSNRKKVIAAMVSIFLEGMASQPGQDGG